MSIYDELGEAYDAMIDWETRLARDLPLIRSFLDEAQAESVVDAACGTGALAAALHAAGYDAVGVDLSEAMVATARAKHPGPDFHRGDLRALDTVLAARVDAVLILGNSLAYLLTEDDLAACAAACARALRPGGLLLVQLRRRPPPEATVLTGRDRPEGRLDRHLVPTGEARYRIEIHRVQGSTDTSIAVDELRAWSTDELATVFGDAGFTAELFGSLDARPLEDQPDLVLAARFHSS